MSERDSKTATRKTPKSRRVCPQCRSRATKTFSISTGMYQCQLCEHKYAPPNSRLPEALEWALS